MGSIFTTFCGRVLLHYFVGITAFVGSTGAKSMLSGGFYFLPGGKYRASPEKKIGHLQYGVGVPSVYMTDLCGENKQKT